VVATTTALPLLTLGSAPSTTDLDRPSAAPPLLAAVSAAKYFHDPVVPKLVFADVLGDDQPELLALTPASVLIVFEFAATGLREAGRTPGGNALWNLGRPAAGAKELLLLERGAQGTTVEWRDGALAERGSVTVDFPLTTVQFDGTGLRHIAIWRGPASPPPRIEVFHSADGTNWRLETTIPWNDSDLREVGFPFRLLGWNDPAGESQRLLVCTTGGRSVPNGRAGILVTVRDASLQSLWESALPIENPVAGEVDGAAGTEILGFPLGGELNEADLSQGGANSGLAFLPATRVLAVGRVTSDGLQIFYHRVALPTTTRLFAASNDGRWAAWGSDGVIRVYGALGQGRAAVAIEDTKVSSVEGLAVTEVTLRNVGNEPTALVEIVLRSPEGAELARHDHITLYRRDANAPVTIRLESVPYSEAIIEVDADHVLGLASGGRPTAVISGPALSADERQFPQQRLRRWTSNRTVWSPTSDALLVQFSGPGSGESHASVWRFGWKEPREIGPEWAPFVFEAAWSPNGRWIAARISDLSGSVGLVLLDATGAVVRELAVHKPPPAGSEMEPSDFSLSWSQPTWSPASDRIAYIETSDQYDDPTTPPQYTLVIMALAGQSTLRLPLTGGCYGISWAPDGSRLALVLTDPAGENKETLYWIDPATGALADGRAVSSSDIRWLDAERLLVWTPGGTVQRLMVFNTRTGETTTDEQLRGAILAVRQGTVTFKRTEGDWTDIWEVKPAIHATRLLSFAGTACAVSPDGALLAYVEGARLQIALPRSPALITLSQFATSIFGWSPDGDALAFEKRDGLYIVRGLRRLRP